MRSNTQHQTAANNRPSRPQFVIEWVNAQGNRVDQTLSSTRLSRAQRHLERLRNSRRNEGLTPRLSPVKAR